MTCLEKTASHSTQHLALNNASGKGKRQGGIIQFTYGALT